MKPSMRPLATIAACAAMLAAGCASPGGQGDAAPAPGAPPAPVALGAGVTVDRAAGEVRVDTQVAMDRGWLEQGVCAAGTREHESLLATEVPASRIHAALLLLGLEPGAPGSWREVPKGDSFAVERIAPRGPRLDLFVRVDGRQVPLDAWVHDPVRHAAFPSQPWVFAGSRMRANRPPEPGEHYVADRTGSIVGIVTFGDEVIAYDEILSDKVDVDAPEWQASTAVIPAPGTRVQLVIRPRVAGASR